MKTIDKSNFDQEVNKSDVPVIVDFSAVWCGPCKRLTPILESYEKSNNDYIKVVKVDIDDSPELASQFSVKSVPTLIVFNKGNKLGSKVGLLNEAGLDSWLKELIK